MALIRATFQQIIENQLKIEKDFWKIFVTLERVKKFEIKKKENNFFFLFPRRRWGREKGSRALLMDASSAKAVRFKRSRRFRGLFFFFFFWFLFFYKNIFCPSPGPQDPKASGLWLPARWDALAIRLLHCWHKEKSIDRKIHRQRLFPLTTKWNETTCALYRAN